MPNDKHTNFAILEQDAVIPERDRSFGVPVLLRVYAAWLMFLGLAWIVLGVVWLTWYSHQQHGSVVTDLLDLGIWCCWSHKLVPAGWAGQNDFQNWAPIAFAAGALELTLGLGLWRGAKVPWLICVLLLSLPLGANLAETLSGGIHIMNATLVLPGLIALVLLIGRGCRNAVNLTQGEYRGALVLIVLLVTVGYVASSRAPKPSVIVDVRTPTPSGENW